MWSYFRCKLVTFMVDMLHFWLICYISGWYVIKPNPTQPKQNKSNQTKPTFSVVVSELSFHNILSFNLYLKVQMGV